MRHQVVKDYLHSLILKPPIRDQKEGDCCCIMYKLLYWLSRKEWYGRWIPTIFSSFIKRKLSSVIVNLSCFCSSADEAMVRLQQKVSDSLKQALAKLKLSENAAETKGKTTKPSWTLSCWQWKLMHSQWGFVLPCTSHSFNNQFFVLFSRGRWRWSQVRNFL